ncbi:hypothetical protein HPB50_015949 [Hyalomma asiaticum]|uniref:Uncharacterized protein n=1 Tax=Hyalomma asiaticum TaxID=266040 RepID=A0ACB7SK69_HYAAI|nr:hypothetical protein HPB50_015949 [Hyalomma asiaticum]
MSVKEASRAAAEVPTGTKARGSSPVGENVHRHSRSEATFATSGVASATEGTTCAAPVRMAAVEESLYALIDHGPYQLRVLVCAVLGFTAVFMEMLAFRVIARPVDHWCRPPGELAHLPADVWKNTSIPVEADGSYSKCTVYATTSTDDDERGPTERCYSWDYDIQDWGDSIVSRFDLVCDRRYLFAVVSLVPALTYAVSTPVAGLAADRFGRKPVTVISSCVLLIATLGCSVAANYAFFFVNRVALVTTGTFTYLTTFVFVYEVTGKTKRWLFTLLHMAVPITFVPPLLNFLCAHDASWAVAHTIFIVPTAAFAVWCSHLDESPTWLLATLRLHLAEPVILTAARLNNVDEQKAREGLRRLFAELRKMQRSQDTFVSTSPTDTIVEDARTRRHAIAAIFSRFACGGIVFGLMTTEKLSGISWQVGHVVFSVACFTAIKWAMDNYGPRDTLSGFLGATCVSAAAKAASTYIGFEFVAACVRLAMSVLASGSMSVIMCYLGDLFPANHRCAGMGLSIVVGGTGATLGMVLAREVSRVTETPGSTRTKRSTSRNRSVPRTKSRATVAPTDAISPVDGAACPTPVTMADVEDNLYALIGHGPYQLRVLACAVLGLTALFMEMLAFRVIARPVNHWCRPPRESAHLPADVWKNTSIPVEADGSYSKCTVYVATLKDGVEGMRAQQCSSWDYDIKDWGDSIVSRFDLVCDRRYLFTVMTLVPVLSYAVLTPAAGFVADRYGRKLVTVISSSLLLIATLGCSVAVNFTFFLVNRVMLVTCGTFSYLTTFVLVYEVTGKAKRWLFTLLHMAVAVAIVPPFLNFLSTVEAGWAHAHTIFIIPTAAFTIWCFRLKESPTWLLATLRVKQAESVILAAARSNHMDNEKARESMRALYVHVSKMHRSCETPAPTTPSDTIVEAIRTRRRAVAAFFSRFACGGIFFGLTLTDNSSGLHWQVAHTVFCTTCFIVVTWAMNKQGPRDTLSYLLAATCVSAVARASSAYVDFEAAAACFRLTMKILSSGALAVIMCYLGDLFPAKNRCTGVSVSIVVGGTGSMLGISLANVNAVRPGFVFDVFYAVMMFLAIFAVQWLPEVFILNSPETVTGQDDRKLAIQASLKQRIKSRSQRRDSNINVER